jgi:hypothetical protein
MRKEIKVLIFVASGLFLTMPLMANGLDVVVIKNIDQFGKNAYNNLYTSASLEIITNLAFENGVIVNYEVASKDKQIESFNVFDGTTLKDLLDQFLAQNPKYIYTLNHEIINIFPKSTEGDETYLFNLQLKSLDIDHKNRREIMTILRNAIDQEFPGKYQTTINGKIYSILENAMVSGSVEYNLDLIPLSFSTGNLTIREILNMISRENHTYWYVVQDNGGTGLEILTFWKDFQDESGIKSIGKQNNQWNNNNNQNGNWPPRGQH